MELLENQAHAMDKLKQEALYSKAAPIAILGVPFDNVSTRETIDLIEQMVISRRPHYLATANVDFLVQAAKDVELRRILFDAHLVLCDGTPLVWASRLLGNPLPERVAGSDVVPLLIKVAAEKGYRPFFLGATEDSAQKAIQKIKAQYPTLQVAGYYSPPFSPLLEMDHEEIRRRIIAAQPDLLFVGFGCPKQEKWINMNYRSLGVPVSVGIGATIDFLAGKVARAPGWMQKSGTEWIFRLAQEPKRLFKRYCNDLWYFSRAIAAQYWRLRTRKGKLKAGESMPVRTELHFNLVQIPVRLDFEAVHRERQSLESAVEPGKSCLLDLSKVDFIDSTGVGLLIRMQKKLRSLGQTLILIGPRIPVLRALEMMKLRDFFLLSPNLETARKMLEEQAKASIVELSCIAQSNLPALVWRGELTAANAEEYWQITNDHISARAMVQKRILIDLSRLNFVDSTGIGVMIRSKKSATRQGVSLSFSGAQENVRNVLRLSRLEDYLLGE